MAWRDATERSRRLRRLHGWPVPPPASAMVARGTAMRIALRVLAIAVVIALSPRVLDGVRVGGYEAALIAAVVYVLLDVAIGWLIRIPVAVVSILPGLLTLGLFFFLVPIIANAIILKLTASVLGAFDLQTWTAAFLLSVALRVLDAFIDRLGNGDEMTRFARR
jgi:uncharacterized membrane protein YvlD (DUF360 family)